MSVLRLLSPLFMVAAIEGEGSIFGTSWVGAALTALFWFAVIIIFMVLIRFIWPPKGRTVIGAGEEENKGD